MFVQYNIFVQLEKLHLGSYLVHETHASSSHDLAKSANHLTVHSNTHFLLSGDVLAYNFFFL